MVSKKTNVAILVPRYGIVDRGVEIFTKEFVAHLTKDFAITVLSRKTTLAIPEESFLLQSIYHLSPTFSKFLEKYFLNPMSVEMLSFSIFCFPKLLFGNYDIIFPQNGVWGAVICRIIRAIKGTPFIYRSAGGREPVIVRQNPNVYIATTPEIFDWIVAYKPFSEVALIPNGVNTDIFKPSISSHKINLERPIYLSVSALIPSKRLDLAINAVAKLGHGSLLILGEGPLSDNLRRLGLRLLGKSRFKLGRASYGQISKYYQMADCFTLPSKDEPFGIVYLEALASGLPVVAPDDKSRRYIIGKAGVFCNVQNIKEYSRSLKDAVGVNGKVMARNQAKKFSWKKIAKLYKDLIIDQLHQNDKKTVDQN